MVYREVASVLQSGMNAHLQHSKVLGDLLGVDMDGIGCSSGDKVCDFSSVSVLCVAYICIYVVQHAQTAVKKSTWSLARRISHSAACVALVHCCVCWKHLFEPKE